MVSFWAFIQTARASFLNSRGLCVSKPVLSTAFICFLSGCAHEHHLDVEPLATGGNIVTAKGSSMSEPPDAALRRAAEDATTYCKLIGREVLIKRLSSRGSNFLGTTTTAEAEFDCQPVSARAGRPH